MRHGPIQGSDAEHVVLERIERELRSMLSIEPSPTLVRRVRKRIDGVTPRSPLWRWAWLVPALAAVLLALVIGPTVFQPGVRPQTVEAVLTQPPSTPVAEAAVPTDVRHIRAAAEVAPARRHRTVRKPPAAEVLVSGDEQAAWQQFIAFAARGPIKMEATTVADFAPIEPLQIAALEFDGLSTEP